jgi:hypothetical protein
MLMHSCCCNHAAKTWTPTNARDGVTRTSCPSGSAFFLTDYAPWTPFPTIEPPGFPQPIDLTESDRNRLLRFCNGMQYQAAWTGGIVVEDFPQPGFVSFRDFSSGTPVWTWGVTWVALRYEHLSILLKDQDALFPASWQCLFFILIKSEH